MNIEEAMGINGWDLNDPDNEYWDKCIEFLGGMDEICQYIPFDIETLAKSYKQDCYFNTKLTPMKTWNWGAGFATNGANCIITGYGLWILYRKYGINTASCSEGVCILKRAARRLLSQEGFIDEKNSGM